MLTKQRIIEKIARERLIEDMISKMNSKESQFNLDDLAQDTYLTLMEKDDVLIEGMYERGELKWYIQRILTNNVYSQTSPYHKVYKKFDKITEQINNDKTN